MIKFVGHLYYVYTWATAGEFSGTAGPFAIYKWLNTSKCATRSMIFVLALQLQLLLNYNTVLFTCLWDCIRRILSTEHSLFYTIINTTYFVILSSLRCLLALLLLAMPYCLCWLHAGSLLRIYFLS